VQYPERVQERLKQTSQANKGQVFAVSSKTKENNITLLNAGPACGWFNKWLLFVHWCNSYRRFTERHTSGHTRNADYR